MRTLSAHGLANHALNHESEMDATGMSFGRSQAAALHLSLIHQLIGAMNQIF